MKKVICLVLVMGCLTCQAALADFEGMACQLFTDVNFILNTVLEEEQAYVNAAEEEVGFSFSNEDQSLIALLLPDETGEAISTGVVICTDMNSISAAAYTVGAVGILSGSMALDGQAFIDWVTERRESILAVYEQYVIDRANQDAGEDAAENLLLDQFVGESGLTVDMTVYPTDEGVRFDLYFSCDPALQYVSLLAAMSDAIAGTAD